MEISKIVKLPVDPGLRQQMKTRDERDQSLKPRRRVWRHHGRKGPRLFRFGDRSKAKTICCPNQTESSEGHSGENHRDKNKLSLRREYASGVWGVAFESPNQSNQAPSDKNPDRGEFSDGCHAKKNAGEQSIRPAPRTQRALKKISPEEKQGRERQIRMHDRAMSHDIGVGQEEDKRSCASRKPEPFLRPKKNGHSEDETDKHKRKLAVKEKRFSIVLDKKHLGCDFRRWNSRPLLRNLIPFGR